MVSSINKLFDVLHNKMLLLKEKKSRTSMKLAHRRSLRILIASDQLFDAKGSNQSCEIISIPSNVILTLHIRATLDFFIGKYHFLILEKFIERDGELSPLGYTIC